MNGCCTAFFTSLVSELFFAKDTVEAIKNVLALFDNQRINEMVNVFKMLFT